MIDRSGILIAFLLSHLIVVSVEHSQNDISDSLFGGLNYLTLLLSISITASLSQSHCSRAWQAIEWCEMKISLQKAACHAPG